MFKIASTTIKALFIAGFVTVFTTACSKFSTKDNTEPPVSLKTVKATLDVRTLWEHDTGVGTRRLSFRLRPAVLHNVVYTADVRGRVSAYDVRTGKQRWSVDLKKPVSSGPTVGLGLVVMGTTDGEVIALDLKTGKKRWLRQVSSEVLAAPLIEEGMIIVRTINGVLQGLAAETGTSVWTYRRAAPVLTMRGNSTPAPWKGLIYAGFDDGKMACIKTTNGRLIWEQSITLVRGRTELERLVDIDSDPVVRGGVLYVVTFQGRLAAINVRARQLLWTRKLSSFKNLAVDDQRVYVTDDKSQVWAFDRQTGVSVWKQMGLKHRKLTGPATSQKHLIVADFDGYLHWLDKSTGSIVARTRADKNGYIEAPVVYGAFIIALGRSGELSVHKIVPKK